MHEISRKNYAKIGHCCPIFVSHFIHIVDKCIKYTTFCICGLLATLGFIPMYLAKKQ